MSPGWCRAVTMMCVMFAATRASGYVVGPAVALEELARKADLVCKATVVADRPVKDAWFDAVTGYDVRETELRVVSIIKGQTRSKVVRFHHYTPAPSGVVIGYSPQSYTFKTGRTYVVFAASGKGGSYRQLEKSHTMKGDQGVLWVADDKPHRGKTVTEAVWAELQAALASPDVEAVVEAIRQLDEMSGGNRIALADFARAAALDAIRPLILARREEIVTAAIGVFGADSPYFDDEQAAYWLAGIGSSPIPGLGARKPPASPAADTAIQELLAVAGGSAPASLRARAIRALGRSRMIPAATLAAWSRDPDLGVRRAAVLVSTELADRKPIAVAAGDPAPEVRHAAALAIGFSQDGKLVAVLDKLLKDSSAEVRKAAAMSLLSFAPAKSTPVMKANLGSDWRPLFVNALARRDPRPYLAELAYVIEKRLTPSNWWGGMIPAGDSWKILFEYVKALPATELTAGKLDRSLDALERMEWYSSSEPRDLYALYLRRGLAARARAFRAAVRKTVSYNIDLYFDMADKSPETYVP